MVSRVRGAFNEVSGSADIAADLADSTAPVIIETASVDTRSADRDTYLRSADFFDVETYPFGNLRVGLEGTRRIDCKDWGVTWNTKLDFELSLIKSVAEVPSNEGQDRAEAPAPVREEFPPGPTLCSDVPDPHRESFPQRP